MAGGMEIGLATNILHGSKKGVLVMPGNLSETPLSGLLSEQCCCV